MNTIKLELTIPEINFILESLGEMPAKTGAFNLILKIESQAKPQAPEPTKEE